VVTEEVAVIPVLIELAGAALVAAGAAMLEPALGVLAAGLYLLYAARNAR
jgi:hypothetical protein